MSRFRYKAFDDAGLVIEGDIDALSLEEVFKIIRGKGMTPFEATDRMASIPSFFALRSSGNLRLSHRSIMLFTRDLAILLQARIILGDALRVLSEQTSDKKRRALALRMHDEVLRGRPLSDALSSDVAGFGNDYVSIIRAGEIGGSLAQVFEDLALLFERRVEVDSKTKSALVYPAILAGMAVVSIAIICSFLVPSIAPIFVENDKPIPSFIYAVMAVHDKMYTVIAAFIAMALAALGAWVAIGRTVGLRASLHELQLKVPIFGSLLLHRSIARFARTLSTLLKSGVPIVPAFESAASAVSNLRLKATFSYALSAVREGTAIADALKREKIFPPIATYMIAVGEETGQLSQLLLRVAILFEDQGKRRIDRLMGMLTPLMTIGIAAIIGILIMSVMNTILDINELASQ